MPDNHAVLPMRSRLKTAFPLLVVLLVILLNALLCLWTGRETIAVPQAAALAVGLLLVPSRAAFQTSMPRTVLFCSAGALLGVLFAHLAVLPLFLRIFLAYAASQVLVLVSGTALTPVIAFCCYPVMFGITSFWYVLAAAGMTLIIVLLEKLLYVTGIRKEQPFVQREAPLSSGILPLLARLAVVFVLLVLAAKTIFPLLVVPPLLAAFSDFSEPSCAGRRVPATTVILLSMGAIAGVFCRALLYEHFQLPELVCVAICVLLVFFFYQSFGTYEVQTMAVALLAFCIPAGQTLAYPVRIFGGAGILMMFCALCFRDRKAARSANRGRAA